jgi:nitroreductase
MTDFAPVVRNRRMTRAFESTPVDRSVLVELVDLAIRSPSAGKTQGWHLVVLEGAETARFWDATLPEPRRSTFRWQKLLDAPVVALPFADAAAYVERYSEPDKAATGLGAGTHAWPVPYWTVDTSMAVMTLLLAAEDLGLGALFFAVVRGETELRAALGVPSGPQLLGAIALGHPASDGRPGRSATRRRRGAEEVIRWGSW